MLNSTSLVSRKHNYKKCAICSKLVINLSQHLHSVHKMETGDPNLKKILSESETVPKIFTKDIKGKVEILPEKQLEQVKDSHLSEIEQQTGDLEMLKNYRVQIDKLKSQIKDSHNEEEVHDLKELLEQNENDYKQLRYKDWRPYSQEMKLWTETFLEYLKLREMKNPERFMKMAVDVLLPYQEQKGRNLSFDDLVSGKSLRLLLTEFGNVDRISATSRTKYIKAFHCFLKFLLTDSSSPERKDDDTSEVIMRRGIMLNDVDHEIEIALSKFSAKRGIEKAHSRKKAENKLLKSNEMEDLLEGVSTQLKHVLSYSENRLENMTIKEILEIRDKLMVVGFLRLGRRTKEIICMTVTEVEEAESRLIDGKKFFIVEVAEHKNMKSGLKAPVTFAEEEFRVLKIFISKLRPKVLVDKSVQKVFVTRKTSMTQSTQEMTFSTAWAILQKFKTESGKPLSSRVVRGSKITHSRGLDISEQERRDLAASMSHSVETAERYYNYKDLKDSVAKSMRVAVRTSTEFSDNTESEEFIDVNSCSLTNFYSSTPLKIKKKTSKRQFSESFETTPKLTANLEDTCHTDESLNVPELSGICSSHDSTKTGQSSRMCPNETVTKLLKV